MSGSIHATAIVAPDAILGEDVEIGPYCVIGPGVEIGARHAPRRARDDPLPHAGRRRQRHPRVRVDRRRAAGQEVQRRADAARDRRPQRHPRVRDAQSRHDQGPRRHHDRQRQPVHVVFARRARLRRRQPLRARELLHARRPRRARRLGHHGRLRGRAPVLQGRCARVPRQQCRGDARRAAVRDGRRSARPSRTASTPKGSSGAASRRSRSATCATPTACCTVRGCGSRTRSSAWSKRRGTSPKCSCWSISSRSPRAASCAEAHERGSRHQLSRRTGESNIALVAGEASGDNLGGGLLRALHARQPTLALHSAWPDRAWWRRAARPGYPADELAVMGLAEIVRHLPRLLRLRRDLVARLLAARPDVFVGIDSPEFNLRVAARLKAQGIPTVQYVSPQVWAWRQGRVRTIGRVRRSRALRAAVREQVLRRARRASGVRRPSARRSHSARIAPGSARAQPWVSTRVRPRSRCFRAAVARRLPGSAARSPRRWRGCTNAGPTSRFVAPMANTRCGRCSSTASRGTRRRARDGGRRPCAGGAGGRRCRAGRFGHRDARNRADQAADGGRLPPRAADGVPDAQHEADEGRVFLAAQPAGRTAGGAGVPAGGRAARSAGSGAAGAARSAPITPNSSRHSPRFTRRCDATRVREPPTPSWTCGTSAVARR